ncbi:MAG: hypothetical protein WCK89_02685 [bacterium]
MKMKQIVTAGVAVGLALAAAAGTDMNPGGKTAPPSTVPPGTVPMGATGGVSVQTSHEGPVTPLAITVLEWGIPYSRGWNVYGLRVNACSPGWPAGHNDIYGIDVGVSGEINGDAAGISCNFFDNICNDFSGIQVGGLYNRIKGDAPLALQVTFIHNRADTVNGIQIGGIWNVATRLRGLQIGLINHAESGAGLQIGLWNECGTTGSPILGAVF